MNEEKQLALHGPDSVWDWPEFQAFAKRLGVDTDLPTTRLVLELDFRKRTAQAKQYFLLLT